MTPTDPAASALAPVAPRGAARVTVPGRPGPVAPPAGPGGTTSPHRLEREEAGMLAPETGEDGPCTAPASPVRGHAETPVPGTGAPSISRVQAPARGRAQAPAGASAHDSPPAGQAAIAAAMSEDRGPDSLDAHIRRLCDDLGLLRYHTHDSRRSPSGYPDLTIVGPKGVLFRELKRQGKNPTPAQQEWLDALTEAGDDAAVWRPIDLLTGRIARELAAISRLAGAIAWTA